MINSIDYRNNITFTGKTYSKKAFKQIEECVDYGRKNSKKIPSDIYKTLVMPYSKVNLEKTEFGYKAINSNPMQKYLGEIGESAGFSTEAGGWGGGWIKGRTHTPLSTKDLHTCALMNLINENTGEQLLFHVFHDTKSNSIIKLIQDKFPRYTKVNIMPGDMRDTNNTVNNILCAVDRLNPKVTKKFYHASVYNPEVVAINGELQYLDNINPNKMSFKEIDQYHY